MSKLIGNNPNQVSSNADLGSAAWLDAQDLITSRGGKLSAFNTAIDKDNVTDVFVYDTTRDSDGGAWRKRCEHTSWYNEELNTSTRGSRREFPSLALIVCENNSITIYDADDPSLPMWMVFVVRNNGMADTSMIQVNSSSRFAVMMNATLVEGVANESSSYGSAIINFISEKVYRADSQADAGEGGVWKGLIEDRNGRGGNAGYIAAQGDVDIPASQINDLAITVLPNSPIDKSTGLPRPTIAWATPSGFTVSRPDGTIVSQSHGYGGTAKIEIRDDKLYATHNGPTSGQSLVVVNLLSFTRLNDGDASPVHGIANSYDTDAREYGFGAYINNSFASPFNLPNFGSLRHNPIPMPENTIALGQDFLLRVAEDPTEPKRGLVNKTTAYYNTGWQPGGVVLATLADTTGGRIKSPNRISNGDFSNGTTDWLTTTGASISVSGGVATVTSSGSQIWSGAYQGVSGLTPGKTYIVTGDVITSNNWGSFSVSNGGGSAVKYGSYTSWNGGSTFPIKASAEFVAPSSGSVVFTVDSLNTTSTTVTQIDNIEFREAIEDRSVKGKGVQVYGDIRRTPVARDAELVAYSGFSSTNWLRKPPNDSNFDFGTGEYCVMGWFKKSNDDAGIVCQFGASDSQESIMVYMNGGYGIYFDYGGGAQYVSFQNSYDRSSLFDDNWHFFVCAVRAGEYGRIWIDGVEKALGRYGKAYSTFLYSSDWHLNIGSGRGVDNNNHFNGYLSLLRIGSVIPTTEQIKRIYRDESAMFRPNAKVTLTGTSSSIYGKAYDESTGLHHIGTSSGRSTFRNLVRVDEDDEPISIALSAAKGLVVGE